MGLYGGLLGWQADDERMLKYGKGVEESGINIKVNYIDYDAQHPNTYRLTVSNDVHRHTMTAISTGGGMIEVQEIDGASVEINGDFHELLIYGDSRKELEQALPPALDFDFIEYHQQKRCFIEIKNSTAFSEKDIEHIKSHTGICFVRYLKPVLPVLSRRNIEVPFIYCDELLELGASEQLQLWELAVRYESMRGNVSGEHVMQKMRDIVRIMDNSIQIGLKGTHYEDRILPCQSVGFRNSIESGNLLNGGLLNTIIMYVSAMMEVKNSLGVIVAAPTAGSCGALPGSLIGAAKVMGKSEDEVVKAMLAAGVIGIFISEHSSFSVEVGGCQAECGAGSSMAAAGLVTLAGGSLRQAITAASLALQNSLGMICDPIANRVEAPCLGRNVMAASNALSCANMALADYDPVVTYDEIVKTMYDVGKSISHELRCTALGGLSITESSKKVEQRLNQFKCC